MAADCRAFIIGDSLFTDTLTQTLRSSEAVTICGTAATTSEAETAVPLTNPDVIIIAPAGHPPQDVYAPLLATFPDLPVICADLSQDDILVITSHRISARRKDLLAAIQAVSLQKRASEETPKRLE